MALNNDATLVIGAGNFLTAEYNPTTVVPMPADLSAPGATFTAVGHTSLDEIFSVSSEGGEPTTIGTLQNRSLRTKYSARQETFNFTLQQFDEAGLKLYYGSNATLGVNGEVQVPTEPVPTLATFLIIFEDGLNRFGFYVPKAEIFRADDINVGDTESLAGLPLAVKPLVHGTNNWTYAVTPLGGE